MWRSPRLATLAAAAAAAVVWPPHVASQIYHPPPLALPVAAFDVDLSRDDGLFVLGVDCYLRTDIDPPKCTTSELFDLYQLQHDNKTWSAPTPGINCCGHEGGTVVPGAPEPFAAVAIPLAACEKACEDYSSKGCTGIIVSKPRVITPPRPDLCKGIPTQDQCSAEICDLKPGQISRLRPGTYYHNKQIFLPQGSAIIGAGINITRIHACGPPLASGCNMTERRGFLMGDDTYVGNFSFAGRENKRSGCPLGGGLGSRIWG